MVWNGMEGEEPCTLAHSSLPTSKELYSAYTVAELWDILPCGTQLNKCLAFGNPIAEYGKNLGVKSIEIIENRKDGQKVADALAKLLINLK